MDWIEQLIGISPDGGNGTLEALYLVAIGAGAVLGFRGLRRRRAERARRRE